MNPIELHLIFLQLGGSFWQPEYMWHSVCLETRNDNRGSGEVHGFHVVDGKCSLVSDRQALYALRPSPPLQFDPTQLALRDLRCRVVTPT